MPCYHPLSAFRLTHGHLDFYKGSGKKARLVRVNSLDKIVFKIPAGFGKLYTPQPLPCGRCVGCRSVRSREWAIRCDHEASLHDRNCFVTLTFDDYHLPSNQSLDKSVIPAFMKRLRKKFVPKCPIPKVPKDDPHYADVRKRRKEWLFKHGIRAYYCGEYGDKHGRPHYHILLFNFDFDDRRFHKQEKNGSIVYTSKALDRLWWDKELKCKIGHAVVGNVTFNSAAYVAGYIMKKITGDMAYDHYETYDLETGEVIHRLPEFGEMSRNPGIARVWFDKFKDDVYPRDFVVVKGKKMPPPKYYDALFKAFNESGYEDIKAERIVEMKKRVDDNSPERLLVKEQVAIATLNQHKRGLDSDT